MKPKRKFPVTVPYKPFLLNWLKDPARCIGYLNAAIEEGDEATFLIALNDVAEAQGGITRLAGLSKIHRVTLHRILSKAGNPKLENLNTILHAMGLKLAILPEKPRKLPRATDFYLSSGFPFFEPERRARRLQIFTGSLYEGRHVVGRPSNVPEEL